MTPHSPPPIPLSKTGPLQTRYEPAKRRKTYPSSRINLPTVYITRGAWEEYCLLYDNFNIEISAYGHRSPDEEENQLVVDELIIPTQTGTGASSSMSPEAIASAQLSYYEEGDPNPERHFLIWFHTHPNMGATPSMIDWTKVRDEMKDRDLFYMVILGKNRDVSCTAIFKVGGQLFQSPGKLTVLDTLSPEEQDDFLTYVERQTVEEIIVVDKPNYKGWHSNRKLAEQFGDVYDPFEDLED